MSHQDIKTTENPAEKQKLIDHLTKIIDTQARLAEADFDLMSFMNLVVQQMQILTPATGVVIELLEDDFLVYRAATGSVEKYLGLRLDSHKSLSGLCIKAQEILHCEDTEKDARVNKEACRLVTARSMVLAPLFNNGNAVGVLKILSHEPHAFNKIDMQTLKLMAGLIGSALGHQIFYDTSQKLLIERSKMLENLRQAEKKLQYQAQHDYLTDLPNRALFNDKLLVAISESRTQKRTLALMYLDIDHFKKINDTMGHALGDALLQAFATRLKACISSSNTAARFGGDEFVLLLNNIEDNEQAIKIAQRILIKVREPYNLLNKKFNITTSIGIAFFQGEDITSDALLSRADQALYAAKKSGRNTLDIFNSNKADATSI